MLNVRAARTATSSVGTTSRRRNTRRVPSDSDAIVGYGPKYASWSVWNPTLDWPPS
jgi:hypothetical protein